MAKITRIKASDPGKADEKAPKKSVKKSVKTSASASSKAVSAKEVAKATKSTTKTTIKKAEAEKTVAKKQIKPITKDAKKPFILIRPFVYFGRYVKESWQEIRQVRWPSRKVTWKLFLAILVYTLLFAVVIMLLDLLFTWLFNTVIS